MIKKAILGGIILLALLIAYNLLSQITNAVKSSDRLSEAVERVYRLEVENRQLKTKLAQIQSAQFIEEQARNKLGLSKVGETIVIIPDEKLRQVLGATQSTQPRLPNWLGWWKMFFY